MNKRVGIFLGLISGLSALTGIAMAATSTSDNLVSGEYLFPGQRVVASGCFYHLDMQLDGNLVTIAGTNPTWASNTEGDGGYAALQGDGNFVIRDWSDVAVWASGTFRHPGARLVQQVDGNTVIYDGALPVWASNTVGERVGQEPCSRRTRKTQVTGNTDRLGGDYKDIIPTQARWSWCGYFCAKEANVCKAWTYVPPGVKPDGQPHCYLKNSVPSTTARSGLVSGRVIAF